MHSYGVTGGPLAAVEFGVKKNNPHAGGPDGLVHTARLPLSTRIYDRTGTVLLAEIHQGSERRHIVPLKQVAPAMRQATIAVEDRSFYQHGGLNLLRTGQAGLQDLM